VIKSFNLLKANQSSYVVKGKGSRNRPKGPEGGRGIALLFLDLDTRGGWVIITTPWPVYPWETPGTHCTERLGGPRGRSGRVRKISPPPEFDPRTASYVDNVLICYAANERPVSHTACVWVTLLRCCRCLTQHTVIEGTILIVYHTAW
jgi:hypothetical protein